jgi:hypothetical protein
MVSCYSSLDGTLDGVGNTMDFQPILVRYVEKDGGVGSTFQLPPVESVYCLYHELTRKNLSE